MVFKKWQKPVKKTAPKVEEIKEEVIEEETPVSSVEEEEITPSLLEKAVNVLKWKKKDEKVIWDVWGSKVVKPVGRIRFEAQVAPVPLFKLPADIRQYLINNWFTSDVYKKDKEWLEKHHANMEMIEKLKAFLTEKL